MMSDHHRRRSPESSRRRRRLRRDSREQPTFEDAARSTTTIGGPEDYQPVPPISMRSDENTPRAPSVPVPVPIPADLNRPRRQRPRPRRGSGSSSDFTYSTSASSSSSSSYLDISRWYPSFGRSGGVLKTFFKTPSEHRPRRRRSGRKPVRPKKAKGAVGVFGFGNNSSSSSVDSDMAYGMGFIKKPKGRGGPLGPNVAAAASSSSARRGPPPLQRRQTDEEIMEIGRKLAEVARKQNREDLRHGGGAMHAAQLGVAMSSWDKFRRQSSSGLESSNRGLGPSRHDRHHRVASSSDDDSEWESASEDEDSDEASALAYGHAGFHTPRPTGSFVSRVGKGSGVLGARSPEDIRHPDRKSSVVDPQLFGPYNSLRDFINTPCGFNDGTRAYTIPDAGDQRHVGSAESASFEARPMQRVFPLQTSDPGRIEAARASGSVVSSQPNSSTVPLRSVYSTGSAADRPDPVPIQAPKPIAPVPSSMYDEERIRDAEPSPPHESRRNPSGSKIFAETALVGAGVAALGAAMLARRDKGKDPEQKHDRGEKYGHDDHREDGTKVLDARKAKELALEREIERLERALAGTNKAREQRRRESKRFSDPQLDERSGRAKAKAEAETGADEAKDQRDERDRDYHQDPERGRLERSSRRSDPAGGVGEYGIGEESESPRSFRRPSGSRVGEPSERPTVVEEAQHRRVEDPSKIGPRGPPMNVFQFQDPEDAHRSGDTLVRAPSPLIIDVSPAPSPAPEQDRKSRRDSFEDEMRDARHIYEEATHSTAPIDAAGMAAAIAATEHSRRQHEEEWRSRSGSRTPEDIQEEADRTYRAERVARSCRSGSRERSVVDKYGNTGDRKPRVVTPPGMSKPMKGKYSEPNADVLFDNMMSPTELREYWPREAPVLDPSAQRPRPVLNLVLPTPVPTPSPEKREKKSALGDPEPMEGEPKSETPSVVLGPRGEAVEVFEVTEPPQTPKSVSWGPSETKQYEVESREASLERPVQVSEQPSSSGWKSSGGGWSTIAAAITGASVGAALARDDKGDPNWRDDSTRDIVDEKRSSGSRSPPKERPVLPAGVSSHIPEEEPEELPPVPGPKPASPRHSQMPGAFGEDLDFTATLAAGLEHSGFDPEIVIEDPEYRRRDSPPGSNDPFTGAYMQPFAETVTDLGIYDIGDGPGPGRTPGYVIGEVAETPSSERAAPFEQVAEHAEQPERDAPKLSKKEQRRLEKAARAAKLAEQDEQTVPPVEAGEDDWADASSSKKSRKSRKSKRSSVSWDDVETPVNDSRVSVPANAFDDIKDTTGAGDEWDTQKTPKKSKRNSKGYDVSEEVYPSEKRNSRRDSYEPMDRDASSVVSDSRYDDRSNGHGHDDDRSVVSAPPESDSKSEKRSSGGFWGILKGPSSSEDKKDSKKDNAGTLGAGAGLAGAAVAIAALARSDAAEASPEQEEPHVARDFDVPHRPTDSPGRDVDVLEDPEVAPRVIKPAIDPQYGDLLPLPPSPSEKGSLEFFEDEDNLPSLPDSRPATPPGQERALLRERERESGQKRPTYTPHSRRPSTYEAALRSPSHTAIPIQFRMSHHRSSPAAASRSSPVVGIRSPPTVQSSPDAAAQEFSPTFKRQPPSRPTSWDSSREFKPLYLLEQAGRSGRGAGEEPHDEMAESTPLPPSRESPAPESEAEGDDMMAAGVEDTPLFVDTDVTRSAALGSQEPTPLPPSREPPAPEGEAERVDAVEPRVKTTPLFVDTDVARSAPLGSQESTPRFPKQSEQGFQSPPTDVGAALHEIPSSSSLSESNYATPVGSPSQALEMPPSTEPESEEGERAASPRLEPESEPVQVLSQETSDEPGKKSYFPSALSMLPAATLAGAGILLSRGKSDEPSTDNHSHEENVQEPLSRPVDQTGETAVSPRVEPSEVELASPIRSADLGDSRLPASEPQDMVTAEDSPGLTALTSPHEAEAELTRTSPVDEAASNETPAPAAVDADDWSQPSSSKKKKKKGKNKKSVSDAPQLPVTAEASVSVLDSSDMLRDAPIQDDTVLEESDKPLAPVEASEAPTKTQQPVDGDVEAPHTNTELPIPLPTDSVDVSAEGQLETANTLNLDQPEVARDSALNQPEITPETSSLEPGTASEDLPEHTSFTEEPTPTMPETVQEVSRDLSEAVGNVNDGTAAPAEDAYPESADAPAERSSQPEQPSIDNDWAPASSKKGKKNKKKKKQSISLPEDVVESPVPDLSDDKAALGAQDSIPVQDPAIVADSPREVVPEQPFEDPGLKEPLEATSQPLDTESAAGGSQDQSHIDPASLIEEPSTKPSPSVELEDPHKDTLTQQSTVIPTELVGESDSIPSQTLAEKPSTSLPEEPELQPQEAAEPTTAVAEEEFPIISKKSKKNKKKRKGSAVVDESIPSSETGKLEEPEQMEPPSDPPRQTAMATGEDWEPETLPGMLPPESQDVSAAPSDVQPLGSSDVERRSPSPAKEPTEPLDPSEQQEVPSREIPSQEDIPSQEEVTSQEVVPPEDEVPPQEEVQPEASLLQSTEISDAPPQGSGVTETGGVKQEVHVPELDTEHAGFDGSESLEPRDASQTINTSLEPAIPHTQEECSTDAPTSVPDQNSVEPKDDSQAIPDQEEAKRREADAAQIQEEEAELAKIQLKRKPSKKDKQRLKDLKARAEKRAEEAEAAATSSGPAHAAEQLSLETGQTVQSSTPIKGKGDELPSFGVEEPVLADRGDEITSSLESQRPDMEPEVLEQASGANPHVDTLAHLDDSVPEESQPPSNELGDQEETSRREAEAALIQEEEAELARLKIKRKPSKKDKERIRALKANAERRDQEAEAAAQSRWEEQPADIPQEHGDTVSQTDADQKGIQSSVEDIYQPALEEAGSGSAEGSMQPPVDLATEPHSEDHAVADMESTSHPLVQEPILSQPNVSTEQDIDTPRSADDAGTQPPEHRDGRDHESLVTQNHPESQPAMESAGTPEGVVETTVPPGDHGDKDHEETALGTVQDDIDESIPQQVGTSHASVEPQSSQLHDDILPSTIVDTTSSPAQDPKSPSEGAAQAQEEDATTGKTPHEPQQSPIIETQPEPEWFVPSKKSKKDKKKKRKGTNSSESGQNSGFATPLERHEHAIVAEPQQMGETQPPTSQEEISPPADHGDKSLDTSETALLRGNNSTADLAQSATLPEVEHITSSVPFESLIGTQESTVDQSLEDQGQMPASAVGQDHTVGTSHVSEPEQSIETTATPSPSLDQATGVSADESLRIDETGRNADLGKQEAVEVTEAAGGSEDLPLEEETSIPAVDEQKQQDGEFAWAPSKKSKKDKKKKRSVTSWTEPSSGAQTPISENVAETGGSRDMPATSTTEEMQALTPSLAKDQQQVDDWSTAPSKKGKKGKKGRSSLESWEPENSTQVPLDDIATTSPDVAKELPESPGVAGVGLAARRDESSVQEPVSLPGPHSSVHQDVVLPLDMKKLPEQPLPDASFDEPTAKSNLHSVPKDGEDVLVAGEKVEDDNPFLAGDHVISLETGPQQALPEEDRHLGDPATMPDSDSKLIDGKETPIVARGQVVDENVPLPNEQITEDPPRHTSPQPSSLEDTLPKEPVAKSDLESRVEDGDDTLVVAGEQVADEVAEPWAFQATHSSEGAAAESDLAALARDGDDAVISAGGSAPKQSSPPSQARDDSQSTAEPNSDFLDVERTTERPQSPVPWEDDDHSDSSQRNNDLLSVDRPFPRPESPVPWEDNGAEEGFATPSEQRPDPTEAPQSTLPSSPTPIAEDTFKAVPEADEPSVEEFADWAPKKMSKKEKRKAKKSSLSIPEPEVVAARAENTSPPPSDSMAQPESHEQAPIVLGGVDDVQQAGQTLSEANDAIEPMDKPDLDQSPDLHSLPTEITEHSGEAAVQAESTEVGASSDGSPGPESSSVTEAATVEETPVLSRKLSKKEKRKAKRKATSSWEDDVFQTSPAADENPGLDVAAPAEEPEMIQEKAGDISSTRPPPTDELSGSMESTTMIEAVAEDEWSMPSSRKKSKKDKKKRGPSEPTSGAQTPLTEEPLASIGTELAGPSSRDLEHQRPVEQSTEDASDPTSPVWASSDEHLQIPGAAQADRMAAASEGTALQKIPSAAPSPDIWENEDYFRPRSPRDPGIDPPEEPLDKVEIHPAFATDLNTPPDRRGKDDRPLVGLGLIHRHSSIFQEDERHTPKLLTMTSDNLSLESVAVEDMGSLEGPSQSGALPVTEAVPGSESSVVPHDPFLDAVKTSPAQPANAASARDMAAPNSGERRPVSPGPSGTSHDGPHEPSTLDDAKQMARTGSVALLAERFGGAKKGSGLSSPSTAHGSETRFGDDNVSATHSPTGQDAGSFTRQVPEHAVRDEEVPLESLVLESPVLGSQASFEMNTDEARAASHSPKSPIDFDTSQAANHASSTTDTASDEPRPRLHDLPTPSSASPTSDRGASLGQPALPAIATSDDDAMRSDLMPVVVDLRRPVSRGLPPVQEEPQEEEAESGKHASAALHVTTPDINRDSGFVADSPIPAWARRVDDAQQRDSGVHLREYPDTSPRLHGSRGVSPEPSRHSRSSLEDEGARLDDKPRRSPMGRGEARRRLRDATPVLEAQEPPATPEPQKSRSPRSRPHKTYPNLGPGATRATATATATSTATAALAGGAALLAGARAGATSRSPSPSPSPSSPRDASKRSVSDNSGEKRRASTPPQDAPPSQRRAVSNTGISRARTPEPLNLRPDSPSLLRHSGTPPLRSRRTRSGDLRSLSQSSQLSHGDLGAKGSPCPSSPPAPVVSCRDAAPTNNPPAPASSPPSSTGDDLRRATATTAPAQPSNKSPVANEGRVRTKDMADVYDGFGEGRLGSPRSPTRPHSMRRRQSMQVLELESRVEQLIAENRALAEAKSQAEHDSTNRATSALAERDNEIETLKQSLEFMRREVQRLTEVNEGLNSAIAQSAVQHEDRYRLLETQHADATRELDDVRGRHGSQAGMLQEKDAEIRRLRQQLEATKEQIREMQRQILAAQPADSDFLQIKDVDYFDHRCQALCSHVQQWVLRFSKFSDMRACRLTSELNDDKIIDRLDNAILDGSNVDSYLNDRVKRRDIFMSVTMTMIWEFVFTRYLFGMDREQRQKLKALEKLLLEVGPPQAVRQWRAVTLTLLSRRDSFRDQRDQDTEAVVQAVFQTLSMILPPPSNLEDQIQSQLRKVMREAVDLSIEMRTQRAEYMMLPPLQPDYDANGDLAEPHPFNAQLMSERSGDKTVDGDELEAEGAIVRVVLFPLVVKKGDDAGLGDDEVVVCPAQVICKKPRSSSRRSMRAPSSDAGGVSLLRGGSPSTAPNRSNVSMQEAEYLEGGI